MLLFPREHIQLVSSTNASQILQKQSKAHLNCSLSVNAKSLHYPKDLLVVVTQVGVVVLHGEW